MSGNVWQSDPIHTATVVDSAGTHLRVRCRRCEVTSAGPVYLNGRFECAFCGKALKPEDYVQ